MAVVFERQAKGGQAVRHLTRDAGGGLGEVEGVGVGPDQAQGFAGLFVAQIVQLDQVAVAIGKLGVALTLAGNVGINLDRMAHFDDQQEGRPAILARYGAGIGVGLIAGAEHGFIPRTAAPLAVALAQGGGQVRQLGQLRLGVGLGPRGALLGLHHEMPSAVQVDEATRLCAGMQKGDGAFKAVTVARAVRGGRVGFHHAQQFGQFARSLPPDCRHRVTKLSISNRCTRKISGCSKTESFGSGSGMSAKTGQFVKNKSRRNRISLSVLGELGVEWLAMDFTNLFADWRSPTVFGPPVNL
ncbi:MAG: hypothetical protein H7245_25760 [Candidatus Saccharibacteria bacterium]|nr:hypothetical protein [Pseudorhodobacter sp.]